MYRNDYEETRRRNPFEDPSPLMIGTGVVTAVAVGTLSFAALRYRVAQPSQYIVRTGIMIPKVAVDKKAFQWPFQTAKTISVQPTNYEFRLPAMSQEKMEFILPGVYTIGPIDERESLVRYATLLGNTTEEELESIIKGIIEGETRVLTANLTLEQIFSGRDEFRDQVTKRIDQELAKLGLGIHNANIQEMSDQEGSEYFKFLRQRARATAESMSIIDISEAKMVGDIGQKIRQRDTRIKDSQYEAEAVKFENERRAEMAESNATLKIRQAEFDRTSEIARIESEKAAGLREAELQREVESKRIDLEKERIRSEVLAHTVVDAEAKERMADADLYATKAEASGILARFEAESEGLRKLFDTSSDPQIAMQYLMIDRNLFPELARANADAIRGLNPKITHWNTGGADSGNPIANIMKNVPPLVDTIYQQTGMKPPAWMVDLQDYQNVSPVKRENVKRETADRDAELQTEQTEQSKGEKERMRAAIRAQLEESSRWNTGTTCDVNSIIAKI